MCYTYYLSAMCKPVQKFCPTNLSKSARTFVIRYRYQRTNNNSNSEAIRNGRQTRTKLNQDPIYRIIRTKQTSDWIIYSRFPPHIMYSRSIIVRDVRVIAATGDYGISTINHMTLILPYLHLCNMQH